MIWASGLPHQSPDLFGGDRAAGLLEPGQPTGAEDGGVFEVDVQHHLSAAWSVRLGGWVCQVEGVLVAGQVAGGDGAADVEGVGRAEEELLVGVRGDRGLQVEGVGQVDVAVDAGPGR